MNDKIRVREVRLVDANGEQLGIVPIERALELAKAKEMDVVEVAPDATPPVCRIMDYARHIFEIKRRIKESRKKAKAVELKEIRMRPKIDPHDFGIKCTHIREFLEKGHKVKVLMRYRPMEMRHYEIGTKILDNLAAALADIAETDRSLPRNADGARTQSVLFQKKAGAAKKPPAPGGAA